mgnify:CR=1 FL=1
MTKTTQKVEDKRVVKNMLTKISKRFSQALHLATVLDDREVTLQEESEGGVEVEGTGLPIVEELGLKGNLGLVSSALRSRTMS